MGINWKETIPVFQDQERSARWFKNISSSKARFIKAGRSEKEASRLAIIDAKMDDMNVYGPDWYNTSTAAEKKQIAQRRAKNGF